MILNKITLRDIPLFSGITEDELPGLNALLKPSIRYATEGEFLTYPGDIIKEIRFLGKSKHYCRVYERLFFWGSPQHFRRSDVLLFNIGGADNTSFPEHTKNFEQLCAQ